MHYLICINQSIFSGFLLLTPWHSFILEKPVNFLYLQISPWNSDAINWKSPPALNLKTLKRSEIAVMVSKRQKLARKRFKEANPELFPKPELSNHGDSTARKKKKRNTKGKVLKTKKNSGKHPFRVPGMRPGENCFICKSSDHIAKLCPEKASWDKNKVHYPLFRRLNWRNCMWERRTWRQFVLFCLLSRWV